MAAIATTTTTATRQYKWQDLIWMDEGIEVGLRFISKLSEVVLLLGIAYAGFKIANKGVTPPVGDEIWIVSQVLALDLSAPGMFVSAKKATKAGEQYRARWAMAIGISLIAMSILSMIDGATQYYLVGKIPADWITGFSLAMTIIRCAAAVGYSVYCRYSKVDVEEPTAQSQPGGQQGQLQPPALAVTSIDHERLERVEKALEALAMAIQQQTQQTRVTELAPAAVVPVEIPQSSETLPPDGPVTEPAIGTVMEVTGNKNGNQEEVESSGPVPSDFQVSSAAVPQINIATRRKSLTTAEVSEVLNCSERYVRTLRTQGKLGKDEKDENLITPASVRAFLKAKVAQ